MLQTIPKQLQTVTLEGEAAGEFNDNPSGERDSKKLQTGVNRIDPRTILHNQQLVTLDLILIM